MSDDIRKLLEKFSVLSEQAATATDLRTRKAYVAPDYTDTTQPKLPLGKTGNEPGPDTFHRMAQTLSNQGAETAAQPAKPLPQPGQKTLPGFGITKIEPETPAYIPKQPWLDPKGSKEPAIMRKAAGNLPAQPLGVIGGTGPDDKFAKAAPPVANEPNIPKQAPKLAYSAPRIKVGTGNEYSNVYGNRREKDSGPTFADTQYAKDVTTQLQKYPDDPNLRAERDLLKQRGIISDPETKPLPNATPLTQTQLDLINQNDRAAAAAAAGQKPEDAVRNAYRQSGVPITIPTSTTEPAEPVVPPSPLTTAQKSVPGVTKEHSEFSNFLDTQFPIRSPRLKEQTKIGGLKPTEVVPWEGGGTGGTTVSGGGPKVTPGPVPRVPANVEVPTYQRKGQPSAMPQGANVPPSPKPRLRVTGEPKQVGSADSAANVPIMAQPIRQNPERAEAQARRRDIEFMQTRPGGGDTPIKPPAEQPLIPTPAPGKPGSANRQRRKLIPPVAAAGTPGGGGEEGSGDKSAEPSSAAPSITTQPVELWRDADIPKTVERPADIPVEPVTPPAPPASQPKPIIEPSTKPSVSVPVTPSTSQSKPVTVTEPSTKPSVSVPVDTDKGKDKDKSKGSSGGSEGGLGTGQGTGIGSGTEPGGSGSSPLGHSQRSVPGVTRESLSTKFYNVFKNFMEMQDKPVGKKK